MRRRRWKILSCIRIVELLRREMISLQIRLLTGLSRQKKQGEITKEYLEECLKDHYGYPASVCNHAGDEGLQTIASMLYCVSEGYALIAWGNPCEYDYERYVLE